MIRTIIIGTPDPAHREMYQACETALLASIDAVKPGRPMGDVFDAHAKVMDSAGYTDHRLNACGYGLGATFSPTWMEQPLFYHGNELEMVPNMVFFIHMILLNSETGRAMALGNTVRVTETACEPLSETPLALVVNRE